MKSFLFFHYLYRSLIVIASLQGSFLCSMNRESSPCKENNLIAFELVLEHGSIINHHEICALALVNHLCNNYIKRTAESRKTYFSDGSLYHKNRTYLVWHPHGSAYAYAYFSSKNKISYLCMRYHYLLNERIFRCAQANWANKASSLLGAPNIFFNRNGDACFYATGMIDVTGHGMQREVIEYVIDSRGDKKKRTRCVLGTKNDKNEFVSISLAQFARHTFPSLTRAIFNSHIVYELSSPWHKDSIKVFHWDGVELPRYYRNHKDTPCINLNTLLGKTCPNEHASRNQLGV